MESRKMIEKNMYHKIKAIRQLEGCSLRDCAKQLGLSVKTVRKYRKMSLAEAAQYLSGIHRNSQFDLARDFIKSKLGYFSKIHSPKLLREIKEKYPDITAGERALRNYLMPLKEELKSVKIRYYEPVLDMVPGHQIQVDGGEFWAQRDLGEDKFKIYFIAFVFSYSRYAYVSFQTQPYNTDAFIKAHIEAFRYFGGVAKEYVYDQTKLVVIQEKYREVLFNEKFHKFALQSEFLPFVCEGYDPESKGKVERFIRYIKEDFLYGTTFLDIEDVRKGGIEWLNKVANIRIHSVTHRQPVEMFQDELPFLSKRNYVKIESNKRIVDKTGLLSFEGNKYSIPYQYQRCEVIVEKQNNSLLVRDQETSELIVAQKISQEKGVIQKNNNHYRDYRKSTDDLKTEAETLFVEIENGTQLIERLIADNPRIVRDQLRGLQSLRRKYSKEIWDSSIRVMLHLPKVKATLIEHILVSSQKRARLLQIEKKCNTNLDRVSTGSCLDRPTDYYDRRTSQ